MPPPSSRRVPQRDDTTEYVAQQTSEAIARSSKYRRQHVELGAEDADRLDALVELLGSNAQVLLNMAISYAAGLDRDGGVPANLMKRKATVDPRVRKVPFTVNQKTLRAWLPYGEPEVLGRLARVGLHLIHDRLA